MTNVLLLVRSQSYLQTSECQLPLEVIIFCLVHAALLKMRCGLSELIQTQGGLQLGARHDEPGFWDTDALGQVPESCTWVLQT